MREGREGLASNSVVGIPPLLWNSKDPLLPISALGEKGGLFCPLPLERAEKSIGAAKGVKGSNGRFPLSVPLEE